PTYVEAARALAERMIREGGTNPSDRIKLAFRLAIARDPTTSELTVLSSLQDRHLADFAKDKAGAEKLLKVGEHPAPTGIDTTELAAWTSVARAILNLHETVTRE